MTIFKRTGSPNYYFDYTLQGIRHAGSTRLSNRRAAVAFEKTHREEHRGSPAPGASGASAVAPGGKAAFALTLGDAMARLQESRWSRTRDALRVKARGLRIVELLGAETPLTAVDGPAISRLVSELQAAGLKSSSVNRYLSTISTVLITARREWGALSVVPFIRLFKEGRGRDRTFTPAEEDLILTLLRTYVPPKQSRTLLERRRGAGFNPHAEAADVFAVLLDTGMRLGEAVGMETRDVDLETNMIHIWRNKSDRPRSVPMTERARGIIEPRLASGRPKVFSLTCADMEGVWRRRVRHLPEFEDGAVLHSARHTFSSRLASRGVPMLTLARLLGHASTRMVERYSHLAPADLSAAVNLLNSRPIRNPYPDANVVGAVADSRHNVPADHPQPAELLEGSEDISGDTR